MVAITQSVSIPKRVSEFLKEVKNSLVSSSCLVSIPKRVSEFLKVEEARESYDKSWFQSLKGFQSF